MSAMIRAAALAAMMTLAALPAHAQVTRKKVGDFPISASVRVPAAMDIIYISGALPGPLDPAKPTEFGNTEQQTLSVLKRLQASLAAEGLTFADVTMMRVYLVGDPAMGGKMDFKGMMASYTKYFGTAEQPNTPARIAIQVPALANPAALVEIEVQAAQKK